MDPQLDFGRRFVGRARELGQLEAAFRAVAAGSGPRWVALPGDRGMGKTRLVQQLYGRLVQAHDPDGYWPAGALIQGSTTPRRLGLDWSDPVERAVAERTVDEPRVRALLWADPAG